jgi:hypothetical protein
MKKYESKYKELEKFDVLDLSKVYDSDLEHQIFPVLYTLIHIFSLILIFSFVYDPLHIHMVIKTK